MTGFTSAELYHADIRLSPILNFLLLVGDFVGKGVAPLRVPAGQARDP